MACGVLQRVVGAVLEDLSDAHGGKYRPQRQPSIAHQRHQWHHKERAANADALEHARHDEQLDDQAHEVDPAKEISIEDPDELGLGETRGGAARKRA